jgi:hypothetical protein
LCTSAVTSENCAVAVKPSWQDRALGQLAQLAARE